MQPALELERLIELRLVVARFGEMVPAKWWNTKGQLGASALRRGFPGRTTARRRLSVAAGERGRKSRTNE